MKRFRRRRVSQNSKFNIYFDDLRDAAGRRVKDFLVVAPKASAGRLTTGVAVLAWRGGKAALLHVYRHPIRAYSWEIPRGFVDQGETAARAARRELAEETGLICAPKKINSLGFITPDAGVFESRIQLFEARDCRPGPRPEGEWGHRVLRFYGARELLRMVLQGKIEDPATLVVFLKSRGAKLR